MRVILLTDSDDKSLMIATKKLIRTIIPNVVVKPIPMKRTNIAQWWADNKPSKLMTIEPSLYDQGWNDCVDYILSNEEDEDNT